MAIIRPMGYLSYYGFSPEDSTEYLSHYGVKGMKWGKRLKSKITDLSDRYITGKTARANMESHQRMAQKYADDAEMYRGNADDRSQRALEDHEDVRSYRRAMEGRNGSSGSFPVKGGTQRVRYRKLGTESRKELARMALDSAKEAQENTSTSHALRNRQRAAENQYHAENAKAASARREYERSLAGKLVKALSSKDKKQSMTKSTVTDLRTGETIELKDKKKNRRLSG